MSYWTLNSFTEAPYPPRYRAINNYSEETPIVTWVCQGTKPLKRSRSKAEAPEEDIKKKKGGAKVAARLL